MSRPTEASLAAFLEAGLEPKGRKLTTTATLKALLEAMHTNFKDRHAAMAELTKDDHTPREKRLERQGTAETLKHDGLQDAVSARVLARLRDDVSEAAEPSIEAFLSAITDPSIKTKAETLKMGAELAKKDAAIVPALVNEWIKEWFGFDRSEIKSVRDAGRAFNPAGAEDVKDKRP